MTIWLATGNAHKKAELAFILSAHGCKAPLMAPADAGLAFCPDETEGDFHGNALLKARALRAALLAERSGGAPLLGEGDPVIADDSGLCADALGGRPGVRSARYRGPPGAWALDRPPSDGERCALLLAEMEGMAERRARFACAMALLLGPDRFFLAQETLEGEIVESAALARGSGGFGYDPIFLLPGLGRTAAELSEAEKNALSHRGKAGARVAEALRGLGA